MRNRTIQLNIRLSEDEHEKLLKSVVKSGLSASGYVRALINGNSPKECPSLDYNVLINELQTSIEIWKGIHTEIRRGDFFDEEDRYELEIELQCFREVLLEIQAAVLLPEKAD
jgi:hypothetical protein